jgi:hypothetical protein
MTLICCCDGGAAAKRTTEAEVPGGGVLTLVDRGAAVAQSATIVTVVAEDKAATDGTGALSAGAALCDDAPSVNASAGSHFPRTPTSTAGFTSLLPSSSLSLSLPEEVRVAELASFEDEGAMMSSLLILRSAAAVNCAPAVDATRSLF